MEFYERLEKLRNEKGVTQKEMEIELGFSNGSVSKWAKSKPTIERLNKVAKYFGVSSDYLLYGTENDTEKYSEEMAELVSKIREDHDLSNALLKYFNLSDNEKKHIIELINLLSGKK